MKGQVFTLSLVKLYVFQLPDKRKESFSFRLKSFYGDDEKAILSEFPKCFTNSAVHTGKLYYVPTMERNLTSLHCKKDDYQ